MCGGGGSKGKSRSLTKDGEIVAEEHVAECFEDIAGGRGGVGAEEEYFGSVCWVDSETIRGRGEEPRGARAREVCTTDHIAIGISAEQLAAGTIEAVEPESADCSETRCAQSGSRGIREL